MSNRDNWATPEDFREAIVQRFGEPALDVCCDPGNCFGPSGLSKELDALTHPWSRFNWCNPPYSNSQARRWFDRAVLEACYGNRTLMLLNACTGNRWFHERCSRGNVLAIYLLCPRIQFAPPFGITASSNDRDSILVEFAPTPAKPRIELWQWK